MFCYRLRINGLWREFDLLDIALIPRVVISQATDETLMWDVFTWGIVDPTQLGVLDQAPMRVITDLFDEWQKDSMVTVEDVIRLNHLIEKHSEPLEVDLIGKGLRLRDCPSTHFNWRDLHVLVRYAEPHSNIVAATDPDKFGWGRVEMLLARMVDATEWIQWSKTKAASDGGDPPDRIPRPGVAAKKKRAGFDTKPLPVSRIRELARLETDEAVRQHKLAIAFRM